MWAGSVLPVRVRLPQTVMCSSPASVLKMVVQNLLGPSMHLAGACIALPKVIFIKLRISSSSLFSSLMLGAATE